MDRCFTYLSSYTDNGTAQSSLLKLHLVGELTVFIRMINLKQHCWAARGVDHEDMGKSEDI